MEIIKMIFAIIIYMFTILTPTTTSIEQPRYTFQSTSTMDMGVSNSPLAPRRAMIYDDDDFDDYGGEGEIVGPGYNPADPATPIGDGVFVLLLLTFIYLAAYMMRRDKSHFCTF